LRAAGAEGSVAIVCAETTLPTTDLRCRRDFSSMVRTRLKF
jgi:hypothetical protein